MKLPLLIALNVVVVGVFALLFRKKNLLTAFSGGRWWLTWLSIAVITLMDELTSIFYAPSEAWRFHGEHRRRSRLECQEEEEKGHEDRAAP